MKVGILTFHTALNYGAVLQTYALYKTLAKHGADAKVIDYRASFNEKRFAPKTLSYFFSIRVIYNLLFRNGFQTYNKKVFDEFLHSYLKFTEPIYDREELSKLNDELDCFISGSDQVWNLACTAGDDSYYLPFVKENKKRNSYAASIGYTVLPHDKVELYKKLMSGFNHISVREASGVNIVKQTIGKDAELVLDPTLLLNKGEWTKISDTSINPKEKYLLIYLMSEDKILMSFAKRYAKEHRLKIIYLNQRLFKTCGMTNLRDVTPNQWLGLIQGADTVVTNSYHGLVFSINFNKSFFTRYIPRSIANSRIETILDALHLHSRRIDSNEYCESQLDYQVVNDTLNILRGKSLNYLWKIVG